MKLQRPTKEPRAVIAAAEVVRASEPEKAMRFDPHIQIPAEFMEAMCDQSSPNLNTAYYFAMLFPERVSDPIMSDLDYHRFRQTFLQDLEEGNDSALDFACMLATVRPDKKEELLSDQRIWERVQEIYINTRIHKGVSTRLFALAEIKQLYPERADSFITEQIDWLEVQQYLAICTDGWHYAIDAAHALMLFPDKKDQIGLDADKWQKLSDELNKNQDKTIASEMNRVRLMQYAMMATGLKILSADEIQFTPNGMVLVNRESIESSPDLPDRRIVAS